MNISTVRDGMKARLATISGLRSYDTIPDSMSPPCAVVGMPTLIEFDKVYARACDRATFPVRLLVGKASDRAAQDRLDGYLAGSGALSVKAAFEADASLSGAVQTSRVLNVSGLGVYDVMGVPYLGADFTVEVYG